jgi:hypothetical protein
MMVRIIVANSKGQERPITWRVSLGIRQGGRYRRQPSIKRGSTTQAKVVRLASSNHALQMSIITTTNPL